MRGKLGTLQAHANAIAMRRAIHDREVVAQGVAQGKWFPYAQVAASMTDDELRAKLTVQHEMEVMLLEDSFEQLVARQIFALLKRRGAK